MSYNFIEKERLSFSDFEDLGDSKNFNFTSPENPPAEIFGNVPDKPLSTVAESYVLPVEHIDWNDGCVPTAIGMVAFYYQDHYDLPLTIDHNEDKTISNSAHYNDYCLPMDQGFPVPLPDCSFYPWCGHGDNCIADFVHTSMAFYGSTYGNTDFLDMVFGIKNYIDYMGIENEQYAVSGELDNEFIKAHLKKGLPFLFAIDLEAGGHAVVCRGYVISSGSLYYSICTGWDSDPYINIPAMQTGEWAISKVVGINFGVTDLDGDGLCKFFDNCPYKYNPSQIDLDLDGIGDVCDNRIDIDHDGFGQDEDCDDHNPSIHPGARDICDNIDNNCNGIVDEDCIDEDEDDLDGDTVIDIVDNCPYKWNPLQEDIDGDGIGDVCDSIIYETPSSSIYGGQLWSLIIIIVLSICIIIGYASRFLI